MENAHNFNYVVSDYVKSSFFEFELCYLIENLNWKKIQEKIVVTYALCRAF